MRKFMAVLCLVVFCPVSQAVTIDWVTVGNPGNAGEQSRLADYEDPTYYGAVGYVYKIGKFEITAGQYCEFLNAVATVATSDLHGVYNDNMWSHSYGCKIERSFSYPNYTYFIAPEWANRPVNFVNWYSALRFCNWLHNGQPTGQQDATTTEDGAYDMSLGANVVRKPGARVWLPNENEWYKAAYHKNDGVTGDYFDYPTSSDTAPGIDLNEATNPGNNANHTYGLGTYVIGSPYYRTPVGEFELSASPYGTFDQGGNVSEWVETPLFDNPTYRGTHGGSFASSVFFLTFEAGWGKAPNSYLQDTGFRVAAVHERPVVSTVTIDWVTVGNPGNANYNTGFGSVSKEYRIGKYEITAGQYTEFLNAVAAIDTYGLYTTNMWLAMMGCKIERSGSIGTYTYSVAPDWSNRPVNYVSWYDCLRFCNWLHNGQPTGVQDRTTTEDGAYDMSLGASVVRKPGAKVWLPSENEWYKAAYHKNNGVTGDYFDYPTSSDTVPGRDGLENTNPGNNANYSDNGYVIGSPYYRTVVGQFQLSDSPYGTFDQGGNVREWTEGLYDSSKRAQRGGSCVELSYNLRSLFLNYDNPTTKINNVGFRVAAATCPSADVTNDCFVDLEDLAKVASEWLTGLQ